MLSKWTCVSVDPVRTASSALSAACTVLLRVLSLSSHALPCALQLMDYDSRSRMKFVMKNDNRKGISSRWVVGGLVFVS
jgi:hypothetical protein